MLGLPIGQLCERQLDGRETKVSKRYLSIHISNPRHSSHMTSEREIRERGKRTTQNRPSSATTSVSGCNQLSWDNHSYDLLCTCSQTWSRDLVSAVISFAAYNQMHLLCKGGDWLWTTQMIPPIFRRSSGQSQWQLQPLLLDTASWRRATRANAQSSNA